MNAVIRVVVVKGTFGYLVPARRFWYGEYREMYAHSSGAAATRANGLAIQTSQ